MKQLSEHAIQVFCGKRKTRLALRDKDLGTSSPTVNTAFPFLPSKGVKNHCHRITLSIIPLKKKKNYQIEKDYCEVAETANVKSYLY